jgi:hypothetical protein
MSLTSSLGSDVSDTAAFLVSLFSSAPQIKSQCLTFYTSQTRYTLRLPGGSRLKLNPLFLFLGQQSAAFNILQRLGHESRIHGCCGVA